MTNKVSKYKDLGPLHDLLIQACPANERDHKSIVVLAQFLGVSHQYIYNWIKKNRVPPAYAKRMCELPSSTVTLDQFHPYVYA